MGRPVSAWTWVLGALLLASPLAFSAEPDRSTPDAAAREIASALSRGASLAEVWDAWSIWTRWGVSSSDESLASDVLGLVQAGKAAHEAKEPVAAVPGPASGADRHAVRDLRVSGRTWRLTLVLDEGDAPSSRGWRLAAARLAPEPAVPADASTAAAAVVRRVLAAVDGADARAFAALSVDLSRPGAGTLAEADVTALLQELHVKYGARPRKLGPAMAFRSHERDGVTIPVLFGDAEDLLLFSIVEGRLARVSVGDPGAWPSEPEADPAGTPREGPPR